MKLLAGQHPDFLSHNDLLRCAKTGAGFCAKMSEAKAQKIAEVLASHGAAGVRPAWARTNGVKVPCTFSGKESM